jgi:hypothetical protein
MKDIVVIDQSTKDVFLYSVPDTHHTDEIEEFIEKQGRNLSFCIWGEFDGGLFDLRNEK